MASLDHNSGSVLALRFQRANAARYLGHLAAAETELGDVLTGRQRILGTDHRDTLTTQHYLAATLAGRGRLADAEAMLRQVLAKKLEILGPGHPDTLYPALDRGRPRPPGNAERGGGRIASRPASAAAGPGCGAPQYPSYQA